MQLIEVLEARVDWPMRPDGAFLARLLFRRVSRYTGHAYLILATSISVERKILFPKIPKEYSHKPVSLAWLESHAHLQAKHLRPGWWSALGHPPRSPGAWSQPHPKHMCKKRMRQGTPRKNLEVVSQRRDYGR